VPALPFAGQSEEDAKAAETDLPWDMSSYAKSSRSLVTKAPPKPAANSSVSYSTWAVGFVDYERRSETINGVDVGRNTLTGGGIGGAYAIFTGLGLPFSQPDDVLVLNLFGGATTSHLRNNNGSTSNVEGPGVGANAIWMRGNFSADTTLKADFFSISSAAFAANLGLTTLNSTTNFNYRIEMGNWWLEPTTGFAYTSTQWDTATLAAGFIDGHTWRMTGGSRFGTSWNWNGVKVDPVLGLFAYDDVIVHGGTLAAALANPLVRTDEGKVFGQATGKLGFDWGKGLSSYIEGEVRGRSGVLGAAGRVGVTYAWN
jgi:hypothetical protein